MSTDFITVLTTRRSVRSFEPNEIPDDKIAKLIAAATLAPTAGNMQAWYFYMVKHAYLRKKLAEMALNQTFIAQAPVVIVVCSDLDRAKAAYKDRGENLYSIQDAAAATQNLLLATHASGLGACWVGAFDERSVSELLDLPPRHRPLALVPIGKPAHQPSNPGRRPIDEIFSEID